MLYKKYAIEIVKEVEVISDATINSMVYNDNQIQLSLVPVKDPINIIKYVGDNGSVVSFPIIYETYEHAYDILSTHYYNLKTDYTIISMSIKEVYDDITPPIEVLRSMKIKQILK